MNLEGYENLPEGLDKDELQNIYTIFFEELNSDDDEEMRAKLDILCDKQWHTYELPNDDIQEKIRTWLVNNWREEQEYLELILGVCYCFGLDKKLYVRALDVYQGEHKSEYENDLKQSDGDFIDPYWSMKKPAG